MINKHKMKLEIERTKQLMEKMKRDYDSVPSWLMKLVDYEQRLMERLNDD